MGSPLATGAGPIGGRGVVTHAAHSPRRRTRLFLQCCANAVDRGARDTELGGNVALAAGASDYQRSDAVQAASQPVHCPCSNHVHLAPCDGTQQLAHGGPGTTIRATKRPARKRKPQTVEASAIVTIDPKTR